MKRMIEKADHIEKIGKQIKVRNYPPFLLVENEIEFAKSVYMQSQGASAYLGNAVVGTLKGSDTPPPNRKNVITFLCDKLEFSKELDISAENIRINSLIALENEITSDSKVYVNNVINGDQFCAKSVNLSTLASNASISKIYDDASGNSFCSVKAVGMTPDNDLLDTIPKILSQKDVSIKVIFVMDGISYSVDNITMKINDGDDTKYDMIGTTMLMKGISEPIENVELKMRPSNFYYAD